MDFVGNWNDREPLFLLKEPIWSAYIAIIRKNYTNKLFYLHKIDDICIVATMLVKLLSLLCIGVLKLFFRPIQ